MNDKQKLIQEIYEKTKNKGRFFTDKNGFIYQGFQPFELNEIIRLAISESRKHFEQIVDEFFIDYNLNQVLQEKLKRKLKEMMK